MRTTLTKKIVATAAAQERPYEIRDLAMKGGRWEREGLAGTRQSAPVTKSARASRWRLNLPGRARLGLRASEPGLRCTYQRPPREWGG